MLQTVVGDVLGGQLQGVGRDVAGHHLRIRQVVGGNDSQAATPRAQVQDAVGGRGGWLCAQALVQLLGQIVEGLQHLAVQPRIEGVVDQRLGQQRTRHQGAGVGAEAEAHQPGFADQVGQRLVALGTRVDEVAQLAALVGQQRGVGQLVVLLHGQVQAPADQPDGFIEGVVGAVSERGASCLHAADGVTYPVAQRAQAFLRVDQAGRLGAVVGLVRGKRGHRGKRELVGTHGGGAQGSRRKARSASS